MAGLTSAIINAADGGAKVPTPKDVDDAARYLHDDTASFGWLVHVLFDTAPKAGTGGYHFRNAVGAALALPTNDKGGYPALRSQVRGVTEAFTLDAPDANEVRPKDHDDTVAWIAVIHRRDSAWPQGHELPEDLKTAPKGRGKKAA